jgi:type IV pilus assembly protein PilA
MDTRAQSGRNPRARRGASGFSLIELLIVVAIILIIVAIAIPNLLKARMSANESAAAENLRAITTAAVVYNSTYDNGFPPTFASLGGPGGNSSTCDFAQLVDTTLTNAPNQKNGYQYAYTVSGAAAIVAPNCSQPGYYQYLVTATPLTIGFTGNRSFCSDQPGNIHFGATGATAGTPTACEALPALQ